MVQIFLIGIAAGAASALLFASLASGSVLSILLFYLSRLPIMMAALGWSHWAALIGAVGGSIALTPIFGNLFVFAFAIGVGLPGWWLGYLSLLARPGAAGPDSVEWYPAGRLVIWSALLGAAAVMAAMANFGFDEAAIRAGLKRVVEAVLRGEAQRPEAARAIALLVMVLPLALSAVTTLINIVSLYLAARIVKVSGRLHRPWPDLAAIEFPTFVPILFAASIAVSMFGTIVGVLAGILAASLFIAYALLGFAVLHFITRGLPGRYFILGGVYFIAIFVSIGLPVILIAMLGFADGVLDIRGRVARRRGRTAGPT
jgi:hypothetical protein